jgi:hypothetical protein
VVSYGCVPVIKSERRVDLQVFGKRVLRKIFGPKRDEVTGGWGNCITRSFITCPFAKYI